MTHIEALRLLPKYFETSLDRPTTKAFHEHLNGCSDCRDQIRLMREFQKNRRKRAGLEVPVKTGSRRQALVKQSNLERAGLFSSLNAHKLASSRLNQRRLAIQFLLAAGLFFLMVRFGVFDRIFQ